jgi:hypothetical protein
MLHQNRWSKSSVEFVRQIAGRICPSNYWVKFMDQIHWSNFWIKSVDQIPRSNSEVKFAGQICRSNAANPWPAAGVPRRTHGCAYGQAENGSGLTAKRQRKSPTRRSVGLAWLGVRLVNPRRCRNGPRYFGPVRIDPNGRTSGRETVAS